MIKWKSTAKSDATVESFQDEKINLKSRNPIHEILSHTKNIKRYLLKSSQAISWRQTINNFKVSQVTKKAVRQQLEILKIFQVIVVLI